VLALAFALGACGGSAQGPASDPSTTATAPSATVEPTPTATPIDIAGEFAAQMLARTQVKAEITGSVEVGGVVGVVSGTVESVGSDLHERMVVSFDEMPPQETERIVDADAWYTLDDQGIWLRHLGPTSGASTGLDALVNDALAHSERLVLAGTEMVDGDRLRRLEIQPPPQITPDMLGMVDPTIADFEADVAFFAEDDGTPAGVVVNAAWVQGEDAVPGLVEMVYRFDWGATDVRVTAPEDPWQMHAGDELGYQMAYPVNWVARHEPAAGNLLATDRFLGTVDDQVQVVAYPDLQGIPTAEDWFRASAQTLLRDFGTEPEVANTLSLADGSEVRILTLHYDEGPDRLFFQQAVVVRGTRAWDINWYSFAGSEARDGATLLKMLLTFEPAGG
jgi:uncharacterized membrane protein